MVLDAQDDQEEVAPLEVPARRIPAPPTISPEARRTLIVPPGAAGSAAAPRPDDVDGWHRLVAAANRNLLKRIGPLSAAVAATVAVVDFPDFQVFDIMPSEAEVRSDRRVYLDIHGGGLYIGGGECCRAMGLTAATRAGARTWAVDYRMPPDHPYPAALDDCVRVYRSLLEEHAPGEIIIGGGSAGGNLAAATILRGRDEGLPLPAAAVLLTPEVDLTESGDSFQTNLGVDTVLRGSLTAANHLYAGDHDLAEPYLSPLFGDFTKGFPPTYLQTGTWDLFLSNTVLMHRALRRVGIEAELHVFEAMPHGGFGGTEEDREAAAEMRRFIDAHWK